METTDYILCECPLEPLEAFVRELEPSYTVVIARPPALCTTMICAEDSVELQPFYLGEALLTETTLALNGQTGHGLCLGDEPVRSYCIAFIDAALLLGGAQASRIQGFLGEQGALLEAAARTGRPILLKRGMVATVADLLRSAQCIVSYGNPSVMLCERGIRTFETATRNTFDVSAIVVLKEIARLPVIADPSHAAGQRRLVPALARSAVAAGADGLIVEVHPDPDRAWSDGEQSLTLGEFDTMMADLAPWCELRAACSYALETMA